MTLNCQRKILPFDELKRSLQERGTETLAHCHGCFDFLHPGHIHHFEFAKKQADLLLVSLNSDRFFVNKGPGRPIFSEQMRAIAIASLEIVDFVFINPGFLPEQIFREIKPDFYAKGKEYAPTPGKEKILEETMVGSYGGKVIYGPDDVIYSSSALIKKLQACLVGGSL